MMNAYSLPTQIEVNGIPYNIRTDFRTIIDVLIAASDPDMESWEKQQTMFMIMYPDYRDIPGSDYSEACKKAAEFIDCDMPEGKPKPRTMDWKQDAAIIIPAVNKVAGKEVRSVEYLHWWTFMGYFMEIGDGIFSQVLAIRQKKARRKKLEKWEKEFESSNPELVKIRKTVSAEQQREIASIERWL